MYADTQVLLDHMSASGAKIGCVTWVHTEYGGTGAFCLVLHFRHELAPRSILVEFLHSLRIRIPHHPEDVEVLGIDVAVVVYDFRCQFVVEILPVVPPFLVSVGQSSIQGLVFV